MFGMHKDATLLDVEIKRCLLEMEGYDHETEDYATRIAHLERLHKLRADEAPKRVSRDTLVVAGANILTILIIVAYEQKHVIQTRGLPFLLKLNKTA